MKKWSSLSQNDHRLYTRQFLLIRIWTRQKLLLTYKRNDIQWSLTFAISPYLTLVSSVNCWPIDQHRVTVIAMLYLYSGKCHCFFVKFFILVLIKMLIKIARIGNSRRRYWKPRISQLLITGLEKRISGSAVFEIRNSINGIQIWNSIVHRHVCSFVSQCKVKITIP